MVVGVENKYLAEPVDNACSLDPFNRIVPFIFQEHRDALFCEADPTVLIDKMELYEHPHAAVKRWMREE